ncbi:UNVERIFIED_CONTAM: hypothetical protein FKN15_049862 [Acipenser sinensis]
MADTLPLDIQVRASTPVEATTSKEPPKKEYTNLYAPVVIEDDSSSNDSTCENISGAMAKG